MFRKHKKNTRRNPMDDIMFALLMALLALLSGWMEFITVLTVAFCVEGRKNLEEKRKKRKDKWN
jgi:hypothetical protein